jgi:DNA-binding response OmpR family regulator
MRILIAGDDEALARSVLQGLEGEPYSGDVLPDGEQARSAAAEFEYDGLILDLNLPKLDGVSVFGAGSDAAYSCRRPGAGSAAYCLDILTSGKTL